MAPARSGRPAAKCCGWPRRADWRAVRLDTVPRCNNLLNFKAVVCRGRSIQIRQCWWLATAADDCRTPRRFARDEHLNPSGRLPSNHTISRLKKITCLVRLPDYPVRPSRSILNGRAKSGASLWSAGALCRCRQPSTPLHNRKPSPANQITQSNDSIVTSNSFGTLDRWGFGLLGKSVGALSRRLTPSSCRLDSECGQR